MKPYFGAEIPEHTRQIPTRPTRFESIPSLQSLSKLPADRNWEGSARACTKECDVEYPSLGQDPRVSSKSGLLRIAWLVWDSMHSPRFCRIALSLTSIPTCARFLAIVVTYYTESQRRAHKILHRTYIFRWQNCIVSTRFWLQILNLWKVLGWCGYFRVCFRNLHANFRSNPCQIGVLSKSSPKSSCHTPSRSTGLLGWGNLGEAKVF